MAFGAAYAGLYDALYGGKDYALESAFVLDQLGSGIPVQARLLELGSGTGGHAFQLVKAGHSILGLDISADMIALAQTRASQLAPDVASKLEFRIADMRQVNEGALFDAVLSLFHVICYMTNDEDLQAALQSARRHLAPGGLFLFDFWHADAVLADPPERRERVVEIGGQRLIRITTPDWDRERSLVKITYEFRSEAGQETPGPEVHTIRYFSRNELERQLNLAGFDVLRFGEWLTDAEPSEKSFGVYCLAQTR